VKRSVIWSPGARAEFFEIVRSINEENPDAAQRVRLRIGRSAAALSDLATGRTGRVQGTYELVIAGMPYIIAYEIIVGTTGEETITVLHVIHGARDWQPGEWPE
jgi:toxin ParE1/3/4